MNFDIGKRYPAVLLSYVEKLTGPLHPVMQIVVTSSFVLLALCVNLRSALEVYIEINGRENNQIFRLAG